MATRWSQEFGGNSRQFPMGLLAVVGTVLGAVTIVYLIEHPFVTDYPYSSLVRRTEMGVVAVLSAAVVATAYSLVGSRYSTTELWAIFGWSVAGMLSSLGVAGGIYAHQVLRDGTLIDRMIIFEELALVGLIAGIGFGITRQTTGHADSIEDSTADAYALATAVSDNSQKLSRRLTVVEQLVNTTTNELPLTALAVKLSAEETSRFPDDEQTATRVLETEVVPELVDAELIRVHEDTETVEYVGPPGLVDSLSGS